MNTQLRERLSARFVARLCPDTIEVWRFNMTPDGRGGTTLDWRKIGTHKGRLMAGPGVEGQIGGGIEVLSKWRLLLPSIADVLPRDRIYKTGDTKMYWEVVGSDTGQSELLIQHVDLMEKAF